MKSSEAPYTKPGRLADVLALIQVLALDPHARRREAGVIRELKGTPFSAADWFTLAREHREFFRVDDDVPHGLSLVARYVQPGDETEKRPQLTPEFVSILLQTAINLHDRQVQARDWWKSWIPFGAAVVAAVVGAASSLLALWLNGWCSK